MLSLTFTAKAKYLKLNRKLLQFCKHILPYIQSAGFKYLMVPVGEGRGLIR